MLKKLRNKLLLVNMIAVSLVILVSFTVIYAISYENMQQLNIDRLRSIPSDVMGNAIISMQINDRSEPKDGESGKPISGSIWVRRGNDLPIDYTKTFVVNKAEGNKLFVFSEIDFGDDVYLSAAKDVSKIGGESGRIKIAGEQWQFLVSGPHDENIIFYNIEDTNLALRVLLLRMVAIAAIVLGLMLLISFLVANRAIHPVEESILKQRRFVADASHELKTPLAIIDSNKDVLLSAAEETVESQRQWIDRIGEESERMRMLIERMLYLAKAEDVALPSMPFDLSMAVEDGIRRVEAVLFERGVKLTFLKHPTPVVVHGESDRIHEAILILLDNAVKYTNDGGEVTVATGVTKHTGYIRVANTGEGIAKEDLPKIFERFYRADPSRTSGLGGDGAPGGYGLGLSIAKTICERSGGKISAASEGGLTTFTIELPICPQG
jgi:signal transduction histidine kinase